MVTALVALIIAPVQDRAISVAEFIKSFDSETIKHVASKEMGEHIIFVHAPNQKEEEIKAKLAEAISASWRKTETGFRLERTQQQANALEKKEIEERTNLYRDLIRTLSSRVKANTTPEQRTNAALQNLIAHQERFRTTRPSSFHQETEFPADWLLFSLVEKLDPELIASTEFRSNGLSLSSKPVGGQGVLPPGSSSLIGAYARDRRELSDFSETILSSIGDGPLTSWIEQRMQSIRSQHSIERVMMHVGRFSNRFGAGIQLFDETGEYFDYATLTMAPPPPKNGLELPSGLTAELNKTQLAFAGNTYGYAYIRNPHPAAIDLIIDAEPLCATEPLFQKVADRFSMPTIVVLDDRLFDAMEKGTGNVRNVAAFVAKAEDLGYLSKRESEKWLVLRPSYLLDTEAARYDRQSLKSFLDSTKKAGYVTIEGHVSAAAAVPHSVMAVYDQVLAYLDRNGYVLVEEEPPIEFLGSRVLFDILKLRGGVPRETIELPSSSLSSSARTDLLQWARQGVATLDPRPGQSPSTLERNGHVALPGGLRPDSVIRIVPIEAGCIGMVAPFPAPYTAKGLGQLCASLRKPPAEVVSNAFWFGKRRGLRLEILLTPKAMLTNEYYESASEMKEMRGYDSLPEGFRKEVEKAYEEMRKTLNRG